MHPEAKPTFCRPAINDHIEIFIHKVEILACFLISHTVVIEMREKGKSLLLISLATLLLLSTAVVSVQSASATPKVYVDPPVITNPDLDPGENFTITIRIANVTEMWSFRVDLGWSPPVLNVSDNPGTPGFVEGVTEGAFLQAGGDTTFVASLDQAEGTLSVSGSLRSGGIWQSGDGILFSVKFTVEQYGATVLAIYYSRVQVKGPPPQYLPTPADHTNEDGFFSNLVGANFDIAVTAVACNATKTVICQTYWVVLNIEVNVTVQNQGDVSETFAVNVHLDSTLIEKRIVTLSMGASTTLTFIFTWDTTDSAKGLYAIDASTTIAPGETDVADNSLTDGTFRITMVGDVSPEFDLVDIVDIVLVAISFGTKTGDPKYNPNADIDNNGDIDIVDIVIVAIHFGETDP